MVPKCCDGFTLNGTKGCFPICEIHCDSGFCSSPNICHDPHSLPVDANTTDAADVDYYDANEGGETSTPFEESSNESVPESTGIYSTTTEGSDDETNELTTTISSDDGPDVNEDDGVLEQGQTEKRMFSWILWISVSASAFLALVALGYVIYSRWMVRTRIEVDSTVSYKK